MRYLLSMVIILTTIVGCKSIKQQADELPTAILFSRATFDDYEKCTFSFEHGLRDDKGNAVTRNDWDLQYGNGGDWFHVNMVVDDRSMIWDLGPQEWSVVDVASLPFSENYNDQRIKVEAVEGRIYLVHSRDTDTDLRTLFRVDRLAKNQFVEISWMILEHEKPIK